jgi:hypothetical protein
MLIAMWLQENIDHVLILVSGRPEILAFASGLLRKAHPGTKCHPNELAGA